MALLPLSPSAKAARTARWATTMTKWAIRFATAGKRPGTHAVKKWQFVSFPGPQGSESRGIVDLLAIRRDHGSATGGFHLGDLFEMMLVQVKGGTAPWPTLEDMRRLKAVQRRYHAKAVVLACWRKGAEPKFHILKRVCSERQRAWQEAPAVEVFGAARVRLLVKAVGAAVHLRG